MKVILTQDLKGKGKKDQMIEVSDGYARNYLLPKKLAIIADAPAVNELKNKEASKQHKIDTEVENAKRLAEKLGKITIKIESTGGGDNRLYGSVTTKEISEILHAEHKIELDKRKITLAEPIKTFGKFTAEAKLYSGITQTINIEVVAKSE